MIVVSRPVAVLEEHRVPVRVAPPSEVARSLPALPGLPRLDGLWWEDQAPAGAVLRFPTFSEPDPGAVPLGSYRLGDVPLFGQLVPQAVMHAALAGAPGSWAPTSSVTDAKGRGVSSVWTSPSGGVVLPFDPDQVVRALLEERYVEAGSALRMRATALLAQQYYRVRPVLPRGWQIALRRMAARLQRRADFPRWPLEPGLHDLRGLLMRLVGGLAPEPVPYLAPWPGGATWALVLTHDVEGPIGCDQLGVLRDVELDLGFRSAWNFVAAGYPLDPAVRHELVGQGFEVGVHGLLHDGRDLTLLDQRLPEIAACAKSWGATGFRFPATHRHRDAIPRLPFDYDSSYPDSDPFEPQQGGCCSWWPFFLDGLVELPITMPQDHTLLVILQRDAERAWREKAEALRRRSGMALLITHPDYLEGTSLEKAYRAFLTHVRDDPTVWHALPRDVSAWWRRRALSSPVCTDAGWTVQGPAAAEARVCFIGASDLLGEAPSPDVLRSADVDGPPTGRSRGRRAAVRPRS